MVHIAVAFGTTTPPTPPSEPSPEMALETSPETASEEPPKEVSKKVSKKEYDDDEDDGDEPVFSPYSLLATYNDDPSPPQDLVRAGKRIGAALMDENLFVFSMSTRKVVFALLAFGALAVLVLLASLAGEVRRLSARLERLNVALVHALASRR